MDRCPLVSHSSCPRPSQALEDSFAIRDNLVFSPGGLCGLSCKVCWVHLGRASGCAAVTSSRSMAGTSRWINDCTEEYTTCPPGLEVREVGNFCHRGEEPSCVQGKPRVQQSGHLGGNHAKVLCHTTTGPARGNNTYSGSAPRQCQTSCYFF